MGIALRISAARAVNGLATQARNYLVPLAEHARQKVQCDVGQIRSYRDLDTWQVGMEVVEHTYRITGLFPRDERFGLCSQMRRASVSIPSNVAESHGRGLARGCLYFLSVSIGSTAELDTQLEAARRLRFVSSEQATDLQASIDRVRQLLYGLRREKERQLATPIASVLICLGLLTASLAG